MERRSTSRKRASWRTTSTRVWFPQLSWVSFRSMSPGFATGRSLRVNSAPSPTGTMLGLRRCVTTAKLFACSPRSGSNSALTYEDLSGRGIAATEQAQHIKQSRTVPAPRNGYEMAASFAKRVSPTSSFCLTLARPRSRDFRQPFMLPTVSDLWSGPTGQHSLFFSSHSIGCHSSTLLPSGSRIQAKRPFSSDSGPLTIDTPSPRSCVRRASRSSTR